MKKILIINEFYNPFIGGMEIRYKRIADRLVSRGHEVDVMCIGHLNTLDKKENIDGVNVNRVVLDPNHYKNGIFGRKISTMFKFYYGIKKEVKNKSYDIVIFGQFALVPMFFSKRILNKSTTTFVDFVEYRFSFLWKLINKQIFKSTDKISCISDNVRNVILKNHKYLDPDKIITISNSVDMRDFKNLGDEYYLFIGRLEPHKNPDKAIKAVLGYNEKNPQKAYPLHIVGDGVMFKELSEEYGENPMIIFHGFVSEQEKIDIMSRGRLLVFPSDREGLPGVFVEAIGAEMPILTTNSPNNNSKEFVIDEKIGEVTNRDIDSIIIGIEKIENNRNRYLENIKAVKPKYDLELTIKKFLS